MDLSAGKHANTAIVKQEPRRRIDEITLLPEGDGAMIRYKGKWALLGYTDGAEGGNRTQCLAVKFRIPIAA